MSEYENAKEISDSIDSVSRSLNDIYATIDESASLRDRFAMAALTGLLADGHALNEVTSEKAYQMADLMLEARKKK
jgi:hypothetical protein